MTLLKRILVGVSMGIGLAMTLGCSHLGSKPVTLPAGALNTYDADTYRVISDSHTLVQSLRDQTAAGTLVLTVQQKAVLNDMITTQNTADHLYQAYKAAGGQNVDTTDLSNAVLALLKDIGTITQMIQGSK